MIYLRTGANGTGKTLLTLKEVREKQLAENRPVYWNGRFQLTPEKEQEFGWHRVDVKDWQKVPDGAIFLVDEAHNDFPISDAKALPEYIKMMAEHRSRGFDFYLITQHPMNLNAFLRRIIAAPGWHQHLKRASGAPLVSVLEWSEVHTSPEKPGSSASGTARMVAYPKEVYSWYQSATLHTAKVRIPKKVWVLVGAVLLLPVCIWGAYSTFIGARETREAAFEKRGAKTATQAASGSFSSSPVVSGPPQNQPLTPVQYAATFVPRIENIPHTAPRYDQLTQPTEPPVIAACLDGKNLRTGKTECTCFTQQATPIAIGAELCRQIAHQGFFQDFKAPSQVQAQAQQAQQQAVKPPQAASPLPDAVPPPVPPQTVAAAVLHEARPPDRGRQDGEILRAMTRPPVVNAVR